MQIRKRYVDVLVLFTKEGQMVPKMILWDTERKFKIQKVLDVRPAPSRKAGGQGDRYLCNINGSEHALFYEDPSWFVEEKTK